MGTRNRHTFNSERARLAALKGGRGWTVEQAMANVSDERLGEILATVTYVGLHRIPPNTPCFWHPDDGVACTYDDLRQIIAELLERRASSGGVDSRGACA